MNTTILEWGNEHSNSGYPLLKDLDINDFIIDASFTQFNGFIPTLNSITVNRLQLILNITFDMGTYDMIIARPNTSYVFQPDSYLRLVEPVTNRVLGYLVFGIGINEAFTKYIGNVININIQFYPTTVVSIPTTSGVFSLSSMIGDIAITTGESAEVRSIFFDIDDDSGIAVLKWNAVASPTYDNRPVLKTINSLSPTDNNINVLGSDIIKVNPFNGGIEIALASDAFANVIAPTLNYQK